MSDVTTDPESIIRVMPETLANKIAAGEVVQRPASAAKELIENSLDAGGDAIQLVLKAAGRDLIQVIDNGCGMGPPDAAVCFQRHATSKIRTAEDLERIQTLGFRGEALASIAAVAQVELRTKRFSDEAGYCLRIDGGLVKSSGPCATPDGTSIAIRNLFFNVPARRNFLKSPATEFKHLVETFQFLALSNPEVAFTLIHDENEVYRLTTTEAPDAFAALRHRISELFSQTQAEGLVPVEETTSYLSIYGFIGAPGRHRKSRGEQFLFVNGRYVKNRSLEHAVASAYGDAMPDGAYPFFTLFLDLDPRHVDVNVHPTKAEVKFDDERGVYGFLRAVVKKALGMAELTPQFDGGDSGPPVQGGAFAPPRFAARPSPLAPATPTREAGDTRDTRGAASGAMPRPAARPPAPARPTDIFPGELSGRLYAPDAPSADDPSGDAGQVVASGIRPDAQDDATHDPALREQLLWQLHDAYILTQIRSGLMIVDQNAAHERILYERALQSLKSGFMLSQQLLFPHTLDFNPADHALLEELAPDLRALGFDLEFFSGRSIVVRGVPDDIRVGDERSMLEDILDQYKTYRDSLQLKGRDNLARSMAKRNAIRPGARLTVKAMRSLIDQLFQCEMPYACPNGRPTVVKLSIEELEKRFG